MLEVGVEVMGRSLQYDERLLIFKEFFSFIDLCQRLRDFEVMDQAH